MFDQNDDVSRRGYREWHEQFKDSRVPMPETGVFAWRRQQLALNRRDEMSGRLPDSGPNLVQRAFAAIKKGLSIHITIHIDLNVKESHSAGVPAR